MDRKIFPLLISLPVPTLPKPNLHLAVVYQWCPLILNPKLLQNAALFANRRHVWSVKSSKNIQTKK